MLGFSGLLIPSAVVGSPEQQCSANRNPLSSSLAFSHGQVILTWSHVSIFLQFQLTQFALLMYTYREKHSLAAEPLGIHCHIHPFPWQQNYFRPSHCYIYFRHLSADLFCSLVWSDQNSLQWFTFFLSWWLKLIILSRADKNLWRLVGSWEGISRLLLVALHGDSSQ